MRPNSILLSSLIAVFFLIAIGEPGSPGQTTFVRQRETNPNYEQGDWISYSVGRYITSIAVGRQYVYFGTKQSGIIRLDQYKHTWDFPWTTSNGLTDNQIWSVAYDESTGFIWCASHYAISYYQPTSDRWHNFFKDEFGLPVNDEIVSIGIAQNKVYFEARSGRLLEADKFGGLIIDANNGIARNGNLKWFGRRAQHRQRFPNFFMSDGYLFNSDGVIEDFNFRSAEIVAAIEDDWGNLWIGTWGLGAGRGDLRTLQLDMFEFGLAGPSVNAVTIFDNVLWLGGDERVNETGGITAWEIRRDEWRTYEQRNVSELRSNQINSITADSDAIWFSTGYGLSRYSIRNGGWDTFDRFDGLSDNIVYDTVADDSTVWIATENGIDRLAKHSLGQDSVRVEPISPGNLSLTEVRDLEKMENLLWAATDRGIYVYDTAKGEGGYSDEFQGPITNQITSISRHENEIWFGTSEGIDVFDVSKREWLGVTEGRLLRNQPINRILAAKDAVWAATDQGVMKFNRRDKTWRTFTIEDGLISNHVNALLLDGDYIWFGTEEGLTQFYWNDPNRID